MADEVIVPIRELTDEEAIAWLRAQPGFGASLRPIDLAQRFGWPKYRVTRRLQRWEQEGLVARQCATAIATPATPQEMASPVVADKLQPLQRGVQLVQLRATARELAATPVPAPTVVAAPIATPIATVAAPIATRPTTLDVLAYTIAVGLAGATAYFSIRGMVILFPDMVTAVTALAIAMEAGKVVTAGVLARHWHRAPWIWRFTLMGLIAGLALINAAGVASQLVAAHVGERGRAESVLDVQEKSLDAKIAAQTHVVQDLDRKIGQIDSAIEEAAKRGRTNTALAAIEGQRKARAGLVDERKRETGTLAALQAERATVAAKAHQAEVESAPIRYVARLLSSDVDSERAIRWLICLMVICADPTSLALVAFVSARRA
jgi:MarR family